MKSSIPDGSRLHSSRRIELSLQTLIVIDALEVIFLSGARPALPMGVAPEATAKCLHLGVGSTCF